MKNLALTAISILLLLTTSYSQTIAPEKLPCSKIISQLSYFWKLDSLANNGFRVYSFPGLLDCNLDTINQGYLEQHFGKPDLINSYNDSFSYVYYCFRRSNMPVKHKGLFDDIYISFSFNQKTKRLLSIRHGYFN